MIVRVYGIGCDACDRLAENAAAAIEATGATAELRRVKDLRAIALMGIMTPPALGIDDEILIEGRVAGVAEIRALLETKGPDAQPE